VKGKATVLIDEEEQDTMDGMEMAPSETSSINNDFILE
jgi:hypothetical protein